MTESLKGKSAVITGVGSGFGKATAELFAKTDQVDLILIDHNKAALNATVEVCRAAGSKVIPIPGDVTNSKPSSWLLKKRSTTSAKSISSSITRGVQSRWHRLRRWTMRLTAELST
jgi:NAD(P)-dependent dehydrogenase (short-subunit alcohol dehydrogenase family)